MRAALLFCVMTSLAGAATLARAQSGRPPPGVASTGVASTGVASTGVASTGEPPPIAPTLLVEGDYRAYSSADEGFTGFSLARVRTGVALAPAPWFRGTATIEFAGEHPIILDAFSRLRANDWLEFSFGYSKPPLFASFVYEPVHAMPFPDRAPVVAAFRVRRDVGADVHFRPTTAPIEGWLRVGNGSGSALGNDNELPAGYAALDLVLGRAWVGSSPSERTFGLRLGAAGLVEDANDRDGITGQTPLGFVYFRPAVVTGARVVAEGHAVGYAGPVRVTLEGAVARESRARDDDGNPATPRVGLTALRSYGLTAELAWVLLGEPREAGRAPGRRSTSEAWDGGALELAVRYDQLWLDRGARDVESGGSQGAAAAVKWWPVDFFAATVAGYVTHYDRAPIEEPDTRWSWGLLMRASFFYNLAGQPRQ